MTKDIEKILDNLHGSREYFREILTNKDELLRKLCRYAELKGKQRKLPEWSIIGEVLGHGSGVSAAIYELYRKEDDNNRTA